MMRSSWLIAATCLSAFVITSSAVAQKAPPPSKPPMSKKVPLKKVPPKKPLPSTKPIVTPAPAAKPIPLTIPPEVTACMSRAAVLEQEEEKLDNYTSRSVGMTTEINQLQRRIKELQNRKARLGKVLRKQTRKVRNMRAAYKKQCTKHENCDRYESQASSLERQSKPIEKALNQISADITDVRKTISTLQARIAPLRNDYRQNKCGNLVPGQTTQEVINKCTNIFSQWNDLQSAVNYNNRRMSTLKSSYKRYANQLESLNNRASSVSAYLAKNCANSPKKAQMDRYQAVRERAKKLGAELDATILEIGKLKKEPLVLPR